MPKRIIWELLCWRVAFWEERKKKKISFSGLLYIMLVKIIVSVSLWRSKSDDHGIQGCWSRRTRRVPRAIHRAALAHQWPPGGSWAFGVVCCWLCVHISIQRVALEPVRGLLVEFYRDPTTSCQREPWSEAPAGFRVILGALFWKEIKGGEGSRSQVQSCCGCSGKS